MKPRAVWWKVLFWMWFSFWSRLEHSASQSPSSWMPLQTSRKEAYWIKGPTRTHSRQSLYFYRFDHLLKHLKELPLFLKYQSDLTLKELQSQNVAENGIIRHSHIEGWHSNSTKAGDIHKWFKYMASPTISRTPGTRWVILKQQKRSCWLPKNGNSLCN